MTQFQALHTRFSNSLLNWLIDRRLIREPAEPIEEECVWLCVSVEKIKYKFISVVLQTSSEINYEMACEKTE